MMSLILAALLATAQPAAPGGSGPSPAVMVTEANLPTHTVYRPANLRRAGRLPLVVWGNGGCRNLGNSAQAFLTELASQGFVVVAIGPIGELPAPRQRTAETPRPGAGSEDGVWRPATTTAAMIRAIDWAVAENSRRGSLYRGRIDIRRIAVAGHSCGGLLALTAGADPRVTTTLIMNSGALNDGTRPEGVDATKASLTRLHGPVLYVTGGPSDVAHPNALDDFGRIGQVPVFLASRDVGHGGTYREPNGGAYGRLAGAWLRWRLKGDRAAAAEFAPNGAFARDPAWTLSARNTR
jgi:dienelactone hydrolase